MSDNLPQFVFELLPPLAAGFSRVLARAGACLEDFFCLYLISRSKTLHKSAKAVPRSELLNSLVSGLGLANATRGAELVSNVTGEGLTIEDASMVTLTPAGERLLANVSDELQSSAAEFFHDQSRATSASLEYFLRKTDQNQALMDMLVDAFLGRSVNKQLQLPMRTAEAADNSSDGDLDEDILAS